MTRLLVVACILFTACDSAERRDAETVVAAVQRFRTADNASTPGMVEALRSTPCKNKEPCRVRDECVETGEATAKALRLKAEVERSLAALEKGTLPKDSPEAQALPAMLDQAETLLRKGHEGLAQCDAGVLALRRAHGF